MNIEDIKLVNDLYSQAQRIDKNWLAREGVDWSEAAQLVRMINILPVEARRYHTELRQIVEHAEQNDEWDCEFVAKWPEMVIDFSKGCDKAFDYEADKDCWKVFSMSGTGEQEWKATCETQGIAEMLVDALQTSQ